MVRPTSSADTAADFDGALEHEVAHQLAKGLGLRAFAEDRAAQV